MVDVARSGNFAGDSAREGIWPGNYVNLVGFATWGYFLGPLDHKFELRA